MNQRYFIGLMSGTSLDGIDAALISLEPQFRLLDCHSTPLPGPLRQRILALTQPGDNEIEQLGRLDQELAQIFASAVQQLLAKSGYSASQITAIGSHGQTVRHRPEAGFSLQAGDPNLIAELTGITTLADFRRRDIAAGGQGAPLVPAFHHALFTQPGQDRVIINIGGMANLTLLPGSAGATVSGFDTGPGNILLDSWIWQQRQLSYDADGAWARSGQINEGLLAHLLSEPFFSQPAPKSTGRELFNPAWLDRHLNLHPAMESADVQATLTELTAVTIADAVRLQSLQQPALFLCGGGSHNRLLMERLQLHLPGLQIDSTKALGLDPDWVEAAAFAWLAARTLDGLSGNLPAVTGAKGERILGAIYPA